jgi:hypothetical protein
MARLLSARRCGSTIIQRIIFYMINKREGGISKQHANPNTNPDKEKIVVIVRNPAGQLLSLFRVFFLDKNKIEKKITYNNLKHFLDVDKYKTILVSTDLQINEQLCLKYKDDDRVLFLEYEEVLSQENYDVLIDKACKFFDIEISEEEYKFIHENYIKSTIKEMTDSLGTFDRHQSSFHGNHVGEEIGDYRELFEPDALELFEKTIENARKANKKWEIE